jgi:hypothetical protein
MNTERTAFPLFVLLSATPFQVKQYSTGSLSFVNYVYSKIEYSSGGNHDMGGEESRRNAAPLLLTPPSVGALYECCLAVLAFTFVKLI